MTEEESLKYHKEKLQLLTEIYKSQFRRLYDSLATSHKKFKIDHRQYLLKKRQEQGNPNASTYSLSSNNQSTSDQNPTTPLPDNSNPKESSSTISTSNTVITSDSSAEKEIDLIYKDSNIMQEIKKNNLSFFNEKSNRQSLEQESSFTAVSFH